MHPSARINGFGIWYDTYGGVIHVRQVDVPALDKMVDEAMKRMVNATVDEWCEFWERHWKVYLKMSDKAVQKYWNEVVSHATI